MTRKSRKTSPLATLEIELKEDAYGPTNANTHHGRLRLEHGERYTFRLGDLEAEALILNDTDRLLPRRSKPGRNVAFQEWIHEVQRVDRLLARGGVYGGQEDSYYSPSASRCLRTVGFACRSYGPETNHRYQKPRQREATKAGVLPSLSIIAVCAGRAHSCLAMSLPDCGRYGCGIHPFPPALKAFLSDPRLSFAGVGIARDAARLRDDWGVPLAHPRELKSPVIRAFREEWLRGEFGMKGEERFAAMARVVLGGVVVEEEPQRTINQQGYYNEDEHKRIAYVIRDACLAYEIVVKCDGMIAAARQKTMGK